MGQITSVLLGGPLRIAAVALGLLVVAGAGGIATGVLGAPSVTGVNTHFDTVNDTTTTIQSELGVHNPNPIGIRLGGTSVDYAVRMNGITMATGTKSGIGIGTGNSTLNFTTQLQNKRIPDWWVTHLNNGERTSLSIDANVHSSLLGQTFGPAPVERTITTDISSSFNSTKTRPINANQPVVTDPVLYLNKTRGHWGDVTETRTPIQMVFTVYNPNSYPVSASSIGYDATMNDVPVGSGSSERSVSIPPGETREVEARIAIDNQHLDEWWVTHLERNQVTTLSIRLYARIDLSQVGGGSIRIPLDHLNHTMETDIFGNKDENPSGSEAGKNTNGGGDDTGTAASPTGGMTTETPAKTTTETLTETPTTAGDGNHGGGENGGEVTTTDGGGIL